MNDNFRTPLIRYYVDIRPYVQPSQASRSSTASNVESLPLLDTLPADLQHGIRQYRRASDRFMSLASNLLKYYFIHKTAQIPWSQVKVSRTPKPHGRPYWDAPNGLRNSACPGLEFNVSHQAGLVVLIGCKTPTTHHDARTASNGPSLHRSETSRNPDPTAVRELADEFELQEYDDVKLGIDIACSNELSRTPDLSTKQKFEDWVDVFSEMFSFREQQYMKNSKPDPSTGMTEYQERARRFYTYWALKEAYIKMIGEGLIADWLRDLEFVNVPLPVPTEVGQAPPLTRLGPEKISDLQILFKGKDISRSTTVELEAFEQDYVIATMLRGVQGTVDEIVWKEIDLSGDIRACATETCYCLKLE